MTDDGKIFHGSGVGDAFGPRCFKGDIMGCGIMFPRDYILDGEGEGGSVKVIQLHRHSFKWFACRVGGFALISTYRGLA